MGEQHYSHYFDGVQYGKTNNILAVEARCGRATPQPLFFPSVSSHDNDNNIYFLSLKLFTRSNHIHQTFVAVQTRNDIRVHVTWMLTPLRDISCVQEDEVPHVHFPLFVFRVWSLIRELWMGSTMLSTTGCFPELCFLQFSVTQVLVGLRKQLINNFVFPT